MRVRHNWAANFANTAWTAVIGLVVVPFYLRYLGIQAYGLIGFFIALQGIFVLLDMGLTPTINREVARCRSSGNLPEARNLLHTLALIYWATAAVIAVAMLFLGGAVGRFWFQSGGLPPEVIAQAVILMGLVIACRWPLSIYTGAMMGAERIVEASIVGILMVTIANVGALVILAFVSATIQAFFLWQALAGIAYVLVMRHMAWRALKEDSRARFDLDGLKRIWRFSAGMGVTGILGIIFAQSDKIVLARMVDLEALGYYTLAGLVARLLYLFLTPTFNVIYPRMTALFTAGDEGELLSLYRRGTRLLLAIIFPLTAWVCVFAAELVTLWTGKAQVGQIVAPLVSLILVGTALNGVMHFPYAAQLASGRSHLAALISAILLAIFVPMLVLLTARYGMIGAAASWAAFNGLYVLLGTWLTHRVIFPGLAMRWLSVDVGIPLLIAGIIAGGGGLFLKSWQMGPWPSLIGGACLALIASVMTIVSSPGLMMTLKKLRHDSRPEQFIYEVV